ncbi:MAG: hypothetical protein HY692_02995, partial [Cyanobacteria bacterium NC_groundwater_1444_Ag_S-0.65um_54_12]|nr:hypothetical protein [Cyanobacteria bacterium NC_groundwater_1444_Ag_S-0.65um_54_12]
MRTIVNSLVGLTVAVTSGCGIGKDNLPPTALIGQPTSGPVLQTRTVGYVSAKEGLVMAQQAASQWDTAAELARIEGTTIEHSYMLGDWNYTFYSPFQRDLALLVIYDGFITKTFTVRREPFSRPIFGGIFRIDSREAI